MTFQIKLKSHRSTEWFDAWIEEQADGKTVTVCEAGFVVPAYCNTILIETIVTQHPYRRKGYATALIQEIERHFGRKVEPEAVMGTTAARGFWKSLGWTDSAT